jgi:hypothetical protein
MELGRCLSRRLEQATLADLYEISDAARQGFCFSAFLFVSGVAASILNNHGVWKVVAGVGTLGILGTGWLIHRTIQPILPPSSPHAISNRIM